MIEWLGWSRVLLVDGRLYDIGLLYCFGLWGIFD